MKVSCPACDSKYTIADEKVAGRKVKVRCKSCGGQILINGTIPPPAPDAGDAEAETGTNAPRPISLSSAPPPNASTGHARSERPSAPIDPIDDGITWSVNVTETDERSLKTHEVVAGYLSGEFSGEVYVWHDGMSDWATIPDVPQLAAAVAQAQQSESQGTSKPALSSDESLPANVDTATVKQKALPSLAKGAKSGEPLASLPAASGKKNAARITGAKRPENAHDLFAAASAAGSETDVSVSEEDEEAVQKRTGARNENSVLFSLDALKAGITAAPAASASKGAGGKKAPASPRKKIEDIMGTAAGPIAVGPGATLLNANQALLTAPAPPPPPAPKPEPVIPADGGAAAAAAAIQYAREKEKTKRLIIGSVAAILVVGGIAGIAIAMTKRSEPAPVASSNASVAVAAAPTPEPVKATPPPTAEEPKPAESASASAAVSSAPKAAGVAAGPVKTGSGAVASNAGPKTEPKKETKKEEPSGPISSGAANFNKEAAGQALAVAASQTSICKKPDGPTGQGKVQVTFAPSGRATTANIVSGPFGGTAVGGCVSGVFKRARVPAFAGDPVTVAKSFSISP